MSASDCPYKRDDCAGGALCIKQYDCPLFKHVGVHSIKFPSSYDAAPAKLDDLVSVLVAQKSLCKGEALIDLGRLDQDGPTAELDIFYLRPETVSERDVRLRREQQEASRREQSDREQLARLQAKYGDSR